MESNDNCDFLTRETGEVLVKQILEELKQFREDVKCEVRKLAQKLDDYISFRNVERDNKLTQFCVDSCASKRTDVTATQMLNLHKSQAPAHSHVIAADSDRTTSSIDSALEEKQVTSARDSARVVEIVKAELVEENRFQSPGKSPSKGAVCEEGEASSIQMQANDQLASNSLEKTVNNSSDMIISPFDCIGKGHYETPAVLPPKLLNLPFQSIQTEENLQSNLVPVGGESTQSIFNRMHFGSQYYQCINCTTYFLSKKALAKHFCTFRQQSFQCDVCNKSFKTMSRLKCHKSIHTGVKPFKCKACSKSFKRNSDLRRHLNTRSHHDVQQLLLGENVKNRFSQPTISSVPSAIVKLDEAESTNLSRF